jgi:hypothetical protein
MPGVLATESPRTQLHAPTIPSPPERLRVLLSRIDWINPLSCKVYKEALPLIHETCGSFYIFLHGISYLKILNPYFRSPSLHGALPDALIFIL